MSGMRAGGPAVEAASQRGQAAQVAGEHAKIQLGRSEGRPFGVHTELHRLCASPGDSLQSVIARLEANKLGIVMVVNGDRRLLGTITDGDIRRAFLRETDLRMPVENLLASKKNTPFAQPVAARVGDGPDACLRILKEFGLLHLPILDEGDRVVGLVSLDDLVPERFSSVHAVVMAGGNGRRLFPLTQETPKPMLPVGKNPLLEIMLRQLREVGIQDILISTHYQSRKIEDHFGDGSGLGLRITYIREDQPLGTAGALGLMQWPDKPLLVINGDILTQVDLRAMYSFHCAHRADVTVGVRRCQIEFPYGVIHCEGPSVRSIEEKPLLHVQVNAGIYVLDRAVSDFLVSGGPCSMTELIQRLLQDDRTVVGFPIWEYWLDIGDPYDYQRAQRDAGIWEVST